MDRGDIHDELEQTRITFHELIERATTEDLRRRSSGTHWTNRQLLFHMVFGYVIVRTLIPLVRGLGRLGWSRRFATTLDVTRGPFHLINYLGSAAGGQLLSAVAMTCLMDRTIRILQHRLAAESDDDLALAMHFPTTWDPYFRPTMTVQDVYHYGTLHFDHHRYQLSY